MKLSEQLHEYSCEAAKPWLRAHRNWGLREIAEAWFREVPTAMPVTGLHMLCTKLGLDQRQPDNVRACALFIARHDNGVFDAASVASALDKFLPKEGQ